MASATIRNLSSKDDRVNTFLVELYSDSAMTTIVDTKASAATYDEDTGKATQATPMVFDNLTSGGTYYARAATVATGFGVSSWTGPLTVTAASDSQSANQVYAAPNGSAGIPAFRALVAADMPAAYITLADIPAMYTTTSGSNANGYWVKDSNGYIRQWGRLTSDIAATETPVTFPIAFTSSASISVVVTTLSNTDRITYVVNDGSLSTSGFSVDNNGSSGFAMWQAEGY